MPAAQYRLLCTCLLRAAHKAAGATDKPPCLRCSLRCARRGAFRVTIPLVAYIAKGSKKAKHRTKAQGQASEWVEPHEHVVGTNETGRRSRRHDPRSQQQFKQGGR